MGITEILAGLALPVLVIVVFAWIKELLAIEGDNPTDLIIAVLIFDLSVAVGLTPHLEEFLLKSFGDDFKTIEVVCSASSFGLGVISLVARKFYDLVDWTPPLSRWQRWQEAAGRAICYAPALATFAIHYAFMRSLLVGAT